MIRTQSLFIFLVSAFAACGGNNPIGIHDLPQAFTDADCNNEVQCNQEPDTVTCQNALGNQTDSESETLLADVDDGTVKYDSGAAQACLDNLQDNPCVFPGLHSTSDACTKIFSGTVAMGGTCFIDQECANQASCTETDDTCDRQTTCCTGTCSAPPDALIALGSACDNDLNSCVDTAYCKLTSQTGTTGTCTALISGDGTACDSDVGSCANPAYCNLDFQTGIGKCKTPAGSGAACVVADLLPCGDGRQYCDATSLKCTDKVKVGGACPTGVDCIDFAECENAVCVARPKLGEACGTTATDPSCLGNLSCDSGTCKAPPSGPAC